MNILKQVMSDYPERGWQWRSRARDLAFSPTFRGFLGDKLRDELLYLKREADPILAALWVLAFPFHIWGQILRFTFMGILAFGIFWPLQQFGHLVMLILEDVERRQCETEHQGHGSGDAESGPDDPDCPCRPDLDKRAECAKTGCGFCLAEEAELKRIVAAVEEELAQTPASMCAPAMKIDLRDWDNKPIPIPEVPSYECVDCGDAIPPGPFVKVSDDEVIRAHVACRPEGVVVSQVIHFSSVNPDWVQNGTGGLYTKGGTPESVSDEEAAERMLALSELNKYVDPPERVYSGECDICHQICLRDFLTYVNLEGEARFPDGSLQLQVCESPSCLAGGESQRVLAQAGLTPSVSFPKGQSC